MHLGVLKVWPEEVHAWSRHGTGSRLNDVGEHRCAGGRGLEDGGVLAIRAARIEQNIQQYSVGDTAVEDAVASTKNGLAVAEEIVCEADANTDVVLVAGMICNPRKGDK